MLNLKTGLDTKPKVEYQAKNQKNNSVLSAFSYGENPDNPKLNLNPMPEYRMTVMQSYAKSKSEQIDKFVNDLRKINNIPSPKIINDKIFLRRAYLGIVGRIPTVKESMKFLSSNKKNKRSLLIDELLSSEGYVSNWFHFWADLLKVDSTKRNITASVYYAEWIKQTLRSNMPYDLLVKNLITATGMPHQNGATGWIASDENMRPDHMANTVQAFLGVKFNVHNVMIIHLIVGISMNFKVWYHIMQAYNIIYLEAIKFLSEKRKELTLMINNSKTRSFF